MFENTHHHLDFATNGREALGFLEKSRADMVLLDIRMPVMDGIEALTEIRKRSELASLPVIAVTASSQTVEDQLVREAFSGYIRKPFSRQTLFAELARFLQKLPNQHFPVITPSRENTTTLSTPPSEHARGWQSIAIDLRSLLTIEWPILRDSLAINETRTFAHKLFALGHSVQCGPVTAYAAALSTSADDYAVGDLEVHLANFPVVVKAVEAAVAQIPPA